jgi:hypothetical protein
VRRVGYRNGGHKFTGIRVLRVFKHGAARTNFHNLPRYITATRWLMRSTTAMS